MLDKLLEEEMDLSYSDEPRECAARLGLSGAMITEYPLEHRRYDLSEYEPFWAAAEALDLPLSLHTATRRQGRIRGGGNKTLRDARSRATKAFSGIVVLPSDFFRRNVVLSFQEDAIGIRLRDVIGVHNMM